MIGVMVGRVGAVGLGGSRRPTVDISTIGADLAIWFDTNQAYKSSGGGIVTPASILTVSRASPGWYFDSAGVLQQAGNNAIRLDYDPATRLPLGALIEEARTNLLLGSATLSTQSATVTAAAHTLSFYGTGTVTLSGVSTAGPLVGTGANNRVTLTFTPTAGSLTLTVTGDVRMANLELGSFATSPIITVGSQVTRAAEQVSIATSAFPYNASAGTLACLWSTYTQLATPHFASLSDGTIANRFLFRADSGAQFFCISGGAVQAQLDNGTVSVNVNTQLAAAFSLNDFSASLGGAAPTTDTVGAMPVGINILWIGGRGDGSTIDGVLNGHVMRIAYYGSRKTDAQLQGLSS